MSELIEALTEEVSNVNDYIYLKNLQNRVVIMNAQVDSDIVERVIMPLIAFEKDDSQSPVTLYMQTVGGSVADGLVLCNIIDNYSKPLNIIVLGYALSMGTIILCAGNHNPNVTKYCYPFTYALHHSGNLSLFGEANVVKDSYEFMDILDKQINNYITSNTGITEAELNDNSRKQWYMTSQEMKEKHLVDHIIGADD